MYTDLNLVFFCKPDRLAHAFRISRVTATGNGAGLDIGHDHGIVCHSFAEVTIDIDPFAIQFRKLS